MSAKRKDRPVYAWIVRGGNLVPEMDWVAISIGHFRNRARLRAYWAMIFEVLEATGGAPTAGCMHNVVKMGVGLTEEARLPNGVTLTVPSSIAIEALPEAEMVRYFAEAERWLAETYGWTGEEHRQHLASVEASSRPEPTILPPDEVAALIQYVLDLDAAMEAWHDEREKQFRKERVRSVDNRMFEKARKVNVAYADVIREMSELGRMTAKIIWVWAMEIAQGKRLRSDLTEKAMPKVASGEGLR